MAASDSNPGGAAPKLGDPTEPARVVIVDDNEADRIAIQEMVEASKAPCCRAAVFSSVEDAIASRRVFLADIILLDDRLAGRRRAEDSLSALRRVGVACPAIVISGSGRAKRDKAVIRHGAVQFASKDRLDALAVQRLLAYGLVARDLWDSDESCSA